MQIILIGIRGINDGLMRRRCFDLADVRTDNFEGEKTYEKKWTLAISHSEGSYRNQTPMDSDLHFCIRLPHVVIYSLAGSPNTTNMCLQRHVSKVFQTSFCLLPEPDHV